MIALAIGAWGWWRGGGRRADGIEWDTVRVRRGDIETVVLTTGGVEPQNRVEVKPPIGGRIEDILVREGASVRRGQIVAWMSSTERAALLDAARLKGPEGGASCTSRRRWFRPSTAPSSRAASNPASRSRRPIPSWFYRTG